ncbi:sorting and assembly machinery component [Aureococcus anophagefferens]|uniref:Sorting and assembly machinery component n=1 Tax=Aureococcus anophagefferens TaxID=44056 RepID=A0ABR1G1C6_AURAN
MDISSEPCTCSGVEVVGLTRTRPYVITEAFQQNTRTFGELLKSVDSGVKALEATDLFSSVSASLREDKGHPGATAAKVTVRVAEKQPYALKVGATTTPTNGNDVTFESSATLRSLLGHGELATATLNQSTQQNHEIQVSLKKRVAGGRVLEAAFNEGAGEAPWAPGAAETRAQQLGTTAARLSLGANWFAEWSRRAGLQDGSLSDKWSLSYGGSSESRDVPQAPTTGAAAHHRVEVAGVGGLGDAAFVKAEAGAQAHARLAATANGFVAASVAARVGAMVGLPLLLRENIFKDVSDVPPIATALAPPTNGASLPLHKPDKFYLGGPSALRGFDRCGVGAGSRRAWTRRRRTGPSARRRCCCAPGATCGRRPRPLSRPRTRGTRAPPRRRPTTALPFAGAATGGTLFYAAAALLSAPLPGAPGAQGARGHVFANAGGLVDADLLYAGPRALAKDLAHETRAAAGVGLSFAPANFARLELNYAWVLRAQQCDLVKRLQFAITGSFGS